MRDVPSTNSGGDPTYPSDSTARAFGRVLFAGTFDHIHAGHEWVLRNSVLMAESTLFIGITTRDLLVRKSYPLAIESYQTREKNVLNVVNTIMRAESKVVQVRVLPTSDPVGPAAELDFDALVITEETRKGGDMVNEARAKLGRPRVELVMVPLLDNASIDTKISSTSARLAICSLLPNGHGDLLFLYDSLRHSLPSCDEGSLYSIWSDLRDMYASHSDGRAYHNIRHIVEIIRGESSVYKDTKFVICAWFHDAVYDPRSEENESESVKLLHKFQERLGISQSDIEDIAETIMMTKSHVASLEKDLAQWQLEFLELDLAILGASSERYKQYATGVRREYNHLGDKEYSNGRIGFLRSMSNFQFRFLPNRHALCQGLVANTKWEIESLSSS
jgi:phosphopantetheine adenylyltransferase/predicted metal-dependent HD superfamily phosphohydrolase